MRSPAVAAAQASASKCTAPPLAAPTAASLAEPPPLSGAREACHVQSQWHSRAAAAPARMARTRAARHRLPAGAEVRRRVAADRGYRGGWLRRGVARPEGVQRGRDPGEG